MEGFGECQYWELSYENVDRECGSEVDMFTSLLIRVIECRKRREAVDVPSSTIGFSFDGAE